MVSTAEMEFNVSRQRVTAASSTLARANVALSIGLATDTVLSRFEEMSP